MKRRCIVCNKIINTPCGGKFAYCSEECRFSKFNATYKAHRISLLKRKIKQHEIKIEMIKKSIEDIDNEKVFKRNKL